LRRGAIRGAAVGRDPDRPALRLLALRPARRGGGLGAARRHHLHGGEDKLTLYQFGTRTAAHYFCSICGIYTHHRRRSNPNEIGVNLACLDGHTPFLPEVLVHDGQNHPNDIGRARDAGRLLFLREGDGA
jgi:hypothetical protein